MDPALLEILGDALRTQRRKESFERSLGRAVRDSGREFSVYIQIISEVRERAQALNVDIEVAARAMSSEGKD